MIRRKRVARLVLELLEPRVLLSGAAVGFDPPTSNVTVAVQSGSLVINGDEFSSEIFIDQAGLGAGSFRVSAGAATQVNGGASEVFNGVTKHVRARMGDGDDVIIVTGVDIPGDLDVDGGEGNNSLTVDPTIIRKNVIVQGGDGDDAVNLTDVEVRGKITASLNDGNNFMTLSVSAGPRSTVGGALQVSGTHGADVVNVDHTDIGGATILNLGEGNNLANVDRSVLGGKVSVVTGDGGDGIGIIATSTGGSVLCDLGGGTNSALIDRGIEPVVTIGGPITCKGTAGDDTFTLTGADVRGKVNVALGEGTNVVIMDDSMVRGSLAATGGDSTDSFTFLDTETTGGMTVDVAGGDSNTVAIYKIVKPFILIGGNLTVKAQAGDDSINADTVHAGKGTFLLGSGDNACNVDGMFRGGLSIVGGDGDDALTIADASITGSLSANLGDGDNTFSLQPDSVPANWVSGGLSYKGQGGVDNVFVVSTQIGRAATFLSGGGQNNVTLDRVTSGGSLLMTTGAGDDILVAVDVTVGGKVQMTDKGGGTAYVSIGKNLTPGSTVRGDVVMSSTATQAVLLLQNTSVGGATRLSTDAANQSTINVDDVICGGSLLMTTGAGDDNLTAVDVSVGGKVQMTDKGGGTASVYIGKNLTPGSTVRGDVVMSSTATQVDLWLQNTSVGGAARLSTDAVNQSTINVVESTVRRDLILQQAGDGSAYVGDGAFMGNVILNIGRGDHAVTVAGTGPYLTIGRDLRITTGNGEDTVALGKLRIGGKASVDRRDGDGSLNVDDVNTNGSFTSNAEDGNDAVTLSGVSVGGAATIRSGGGSNTVDILPGSRPESVFLAGLTIDGRNGMDTVNLQNVDVSRTTNIALGASTNNLNSGACNFGGAFLYTGTDGDDSITVLGAHVVGRTTVKTGRGDATLLTDFTTFDSVVSVTTGNGTDTLVVGNVTAAAVLTFATAGGDDSIVIAGGLSGPLDLQTGGGRDTIVFDALVCLGRVTVDTGDSNDNVQIATFGGGLCHFDQAVTIRMGRGDDTLDIGAAFSAPQSAAFLAPLFIDGGTAFDVLNRGLLSADGNGNTYNGLTEVNWETIN